VEILEDIMKGIIKNFQGYHKLFGEKGGSLISKLIR
jgi:hypothetical protein